MQILFQLLHSFVRFLIAIILWLLPWWTLAPILVIINAYNFLSFRSLKKGYGLYLRTPFMGNCGHFESTFAAC
jgi:hypothetical protein